MSSGVQHFVYILSGKEKVYQSMLLLAVSSLRRHHPDARVSICTDPATASDLDIWKDVGPLVDRIEAFEVDRPAGAREPRFEDESSGSRAEAVCVP